MDEKKTDKMLEKEADKKDSLLQDTIKQIEKQYGKGSIMKLGDRANVDIDAIPSGSIKLDLALGIRRAELLKFMVLNQAVRQP